MAIKDKGNIPAAVLSQQLSEAIGGRRVRASVFTTFTFDPGFFELHVLPVLFDQPFSQVDKVRRIQLEDALRSVDHLAVYYDRGALAQDAETAQLDYRRIDVRRATGCFHPKVILLLVDEHAEDAGKEIETDSQETYQSLIIGVLSANLTRGGWWENVEAAHFECINDKEVDDDRSSFRHDLLSLIRRILDSTDPGEDQTALEQIHGFLRDRVPRERYGKASMDGRFYTRLFCGQNQMTLSTWLSEMRLARHEFNLEIISPYFDHHGTGPLEDLMDCLRPREVRISLPRDIDGSALVTEESYHAVSELARWSNMPSEIVHRGRTQFTDKLPPRRVHAKVYRLWSRQGPDLLLVGSVNLTSSAHSHGNAGNLEAAFLVDVTDKGYPRRWWLEPVEIEPKSFTEKAPAEEEGLEEVPIDLTFRYDWSSSELSYRLMADKRDSFDVSETSGRFLFRIDSARTGDWVTCPDDAAKRVQEVLTSTSFLLVTHGKGQWRVLVQEENMGHRPSLLTQLTPEEILEYWALLTPEQRATFIEDRLGAEVSLEGIPLKKDGRLISNKTLFDRFAGIYHAFGCLRRHVEDAISEDRLREAEARLLGAKYDSLPSLLQKIIDRTEGDPVIRYITFLCARQLNDQLKKGHREFFRGRREQTGRLDSLLEHLSEIRNSLRESKDMREFMDWYEPIFLKGPVAEGKNR